MAATLKMTERRDLVMTIVNKQPISGREHRKWATAVGKRIMGKNRPIGDVDRDESVREGGSATAANQTRTHNVNSQFTNSCAIRSSSVYETESIKMIVCIL